MNPSDFQKDIPLFTVFILILIISANTLLPLFPCKFQSLLRDNMLMKHLFAFITMIFFVVLSAPIDDKKNIFFKAMLLYVFFVFVTKTNYIFFIIILILLAFSYLTILHKNDKKQNENKTDNELIIYDNSLFILYILIIILTFIGLFIYMGEKKIEYKNKFKYFTFFFGKPVCKENSPDVPMLKALKSAFL
jgi:hypothetical protein